jgi:hypothetical protein
MNNDQENARLLISYELLEPKRTEANCKELYVALDSLGAKRIQDSLWTVRTELSISSVLRKLQGHFSLTTDRLFITQIGESVNRNGI